MPRPAYLEAVAKSDPEFARLVETDRDFLLKEGAIPLKYKQLMTMICDALLAHDQGVGNIANRAREAGASEEEINEAVRIAYLFGGTPALVSATNAYRKG